MKHYKKELNRNSRNLVIIATITALITTIIEFCGPLVIKDFIDNFRYRDLYCSIMIIVLVYVIGFITKILASKFKNWYSVKFKTRETIQLYKVMFSMSYEELITLEPTYLVEKINNAVNTLYLVYSDAISNYFVSTITILVSIILMYTVNVEIAIIFCILIPIQILGYKKLNQKLSQLCIGLQTICAKSFAKILSITSSMDYIKERSDYRDVLNIIKEPIETINVENAKVNKCAEYVGIVLGDLINALNNAVYIYSAIIMLMDKISLADFVFISLITNLFFQSLSKISRTNINTRDLKAAYEFINTEMIGKLEKNGEKTIDDSICDISIKISNFGIKNTKLIDNGEANIQKGDVVFVSGKSGTGKSLLMKSIIKFYNADGIKINGIDIGDIKNESLRARVSYYSQNIPLFNGTILENILMGAKLTERNKAIIENIGFIKKFDEQQEGLNTMVLENGANLSGGDKQKIALCRFYLEESDVVILDEVTSSIDEKTSKEIISDIVDSAKNKIVFIISHDDSLVQYCNKKLVLFNKTLKQESLS